MASKNWEKMDVRKLGELRVKYAKFLEERDWKQFHNPKEVAMGLSIEASELLENFLWKTHGESTEIMKIRKARVEDELADVFIYLLELSDILGVDLVEASLKKLEDDARKYPAEKFRGITKKYNEL